MHPRKLLVPAGSLLLVGSLVAASTAPRAGHDLQPKFQEGQKLAIRNEVTVVLGLDDVQASFGGQELPADVTMDMEIHVEQLLNEEVVSLRDGAISKLRRHHDTMGVEVTGEAGAMGQIQSIDETQDIPLEGHTLELVRGEDGAVEVTDVTEDGDAVEDTLIKTQVIESHFELMLPKREVEVGDSWDVGSQMIEEFARQAASQAEGDADMARVIDAMRKVLDGADMKAEGRLVSVDGDLASIEWTMSVEVTVDDLFELIRDVADPEDLEGMPEDASGSVQLAMEAKGNGTFDLSVHQLTSLELTGEYSLSAEMAMSQDGMDMNGNAEISGTMEMTGGVSIVE